MIAYAFPPEGSAGVYRPLRFVRCLPEMGWNVSVVSADSARLERYDPGLLSLVPPGTTVLRVRNPDPWLSFQAKRAQSRQKEYVNSSPEKVAKIQSADRAPARSFVRKIVHAVEASCYHPDRAMFWIRPAAEAVMTLCRDRKPNVIWATGQPWSSFLVAQRVSKLTGIPFVIDFRGCWTLVPNACDPPRPKWAQHFDRHTLRRLFDRAQAAVFFHDTEGESYWQAYKGFLDTKKIHVIPNGFDGSVEDSPPPNGDVCRILYAGTLVSHRYDTLLEAIAQLRSSHPDLTRQLRVNFYTDEVVNVANAVAVQRLSDIVSTSAPVSYSEINRLQQESHALLMLGVASTVQGYETIVGSKVFGYLKTGRPIIGILPTGEARKVLDRVGVSTVANVDSVAEIVDTLLRVLQAWSMGKLMSLAPDRSTCESYSSKSQTAALIRALEGVPPERPHVPGSFEIPASLREIVHHHSRINVWGWKGHENSARVS